MGADGDDDGAASLPVGMTFEDDSISTSAAEMGDDELDYEEID